MTLTELKYVAALADELHFGRAAAACHVSQPTLSIAVKKLEQSLGVSLFERTRRGVGLTPLGQQVAERARELLAQAAGINDLVQSAREAPHGPLAIGALPSVGPYVLPQCIPLLQKTAPAMPLSVYEGPSSELARRLRSGELDAVITVAPFTMADIVCQPLFDEPLLALLPAHHPLAKKACIDTPDLDPTQMLLMAEGDELRESLLAIFPHLQTSVAGEHVRARVQGSTLESLRHMVASGLGISVLPQMAAQNSFYSPSLVASRPLADPTAMRSLVLAWRVSFPRHGAIELLKQALTACNGSGWAGEPATRSMGLLVDNNDW
ncbi:hydrogen peroxide-inducible genes activator [Gilvimarinus sp. 1_MG-2023]|uniref:hydrogen peroxide-inducible genes activator n=1 Tax=Gilvimarinus sp. 1_MG-2023 TaxID=3062638 RepID=UPI0026E44BC9|nr:hydrogen peroxide-inducible genes activator [Gilvimarinus sp. 1_MG-2023]MDO6746406.1 hydrogen peroxide-inducible genes activator [Gilvimarinus sp. 1_MG-2023]